MSAVLAQPWPALRPVFTVADEELIRFVIFDGYDDFDRATFDDFEVDRKAAASILRKQRREGAYIERRKKGTNRYEHEAFGHYYIEPKDEA